MRIGLAAALCVALAGCVAPPPECRPPNDKFHGRRLAEVIVIIGGGKVGAAIRFQKLQFVVPLSCGEE